MTHFLRKGRLYYQVLIQTDQCRWVLVKGKNAFVLFRVIDDYEVWAREGLSKGEIRTIMENCKRHLHEC